ncbi:hypothetical protein K0B03_04365 [Patescibacteria group bacterium]|nr:hypothetical protein [Patescibacteria group bacterium]
MKQLHKTLLILIIMFFVLPSLKLNELNAASFSKTVKFFIIQESGETSQGSTTTTIPPFTISIAEDEPTITSAFIQVNGSVKDFLTTTGFIDINLDGGLDTSYELNISTKPTKFTINHDITSIVSSDFPGVPGANSYSLNITNNDFNINNLSAKLHLTYTYLNNSGSLKPSGFIISSTVDTGITQGAAFNSMMWNGSLNGGKVRLQLATSDSDLGPWIFKGPDCASGVYYEDNNNTPTKITCAEHNNKRYFRYKIMLCSSANCTSPSSNNPNVSDVIVNWSL